MGDSSSFSSLFALVDNHLSKSNIQSKDQGASTSSHGPFKLPTLNIQRGLSDTGLPSSSGFKQYTLKLPIPSTSMTQNPLINLGNRYGKLMHLKNTDEEDDDSEDESNFPMSDCPINDVLAIQLSNMFKATEAKEEEEKRKQEQKLAKENLRREESSHLIDLMSAVQRPGVGNTPYMPPLSSGSSMDSMAMLDMDDIEEEQQTAKDLEALARPVSRLKPITTDMSYIRNHKIGKCSRFGKVLCARYRTVAAPYFRVHVRNRNIQVFDFSTPSPDDIIIARLGRHPTSS